MQWFLYFVGTIWIVFGCCSILYTAQTRQQFHKILTESNRKTIAIITFAASILLVISGQATVHVWFVRVLGLAGIVKAVLIFLNPNEIYAKWTTAVLDSTSDQTYKLIGIIIIIFGTALFSWIL
ncbi:MAG: hypothetical protein GY874_12090 [Desulfobacteraceae bacterium]|nr:hypothetical protein [Desulfobacteraceae bacterium]